MQRIANEMAFSETTFVFPDAGEAGAAPGVPAFRVRIFTPASELPMAGHPTIGTAFALAQAGRIPPGTRRTVFAEGVGPIALDLDWAGDRLAFAWMTQPAPAFGRPMQAVQGFAEAASVAVADLRPHGWPVQQVSCGVPYVILPVSTRAAVDHAVPEAGAHARAFAAAGLPQGQLYLFTCEGGPDGADAYVRMFAPGLGIPEDPATGSAAGPLGAYLVHHGIAEPDRTLRLLQGVRMGRTSWIHVAPVVPGLSAALGADLDITAVRVGGEAVLAGEGMLLLPE
jgi:trans-2,3-dihydro-3-hydroxyanthranilate isomerase